MNAYLLLTLAIAAEVVATTALKASAGFTRPGPSLLVVAGYGLAFWLLSMVIKTMPVGVAYAIWSGAGIVLITLLAVLFYRQIPDMAALLGMGLIIAGVAVIQLWSKTGGH
ncbi:DMT family transporter [Oceanimonas baumannii]|uniref:QacE family quaternary ammonium compound efflux SMR transporter n=1 Tax=Oceanimonas baumannii TaxID=129578 RepID=A0A235CN73_9GAMM|nr:multidrug efflux SMR transporter [Oceanimonas baumannii]MCC4263256.1 multidrug efflux SMR transporter [Oceanimonas baumannii]OYD25834.1 QacE family quaternary ammonium compound efflux SMR transporter [Oceanimonas baumannii]TDW60151.1 small multidrug resistance pump [Oceanimonas baumannii]